MKEELHLQRNESINELLDIIEPCFENNSKWISSQVIQKETIIIIMIDIPKYTEFKAFEVHGILSFEMSSDIYQKQLTNMCLKAQDVLTNDLSIKLKNLIQGSIEDILSIISTSLITSVKIIIPEGLYRTLEGILQLDCFFTKIEIQEEVLFVFDGKCDRLNYSILRVTQGKTNVDLITKNEEQLYLLYHHLYSNIPDVIILNENCTQITDHSIQMLTRPTQSFLEPIKQDQSVYKEFIDSFYEQLIFLENKIEDANKNKCITDDTLTLCESKEDYITFRKTLSSIEEKTDELFLRVVEKK